MSDNDTSPSQRDRGSLGRAGGALVGGVLVAFSMPPWGWWPLAFLGIIVFETALGEHPTRRERALRGWLFAAGWLYVGMAWMWFLSAPGYLVAGALFAGAHAAAATLAPTGTWRVIGRPAAHTVVEAVRLAVPFGGVPLASLAIGQAAGPLLGIARVGGVVLLTWVVLQIGFALAGPSPFVPATVRTRRGVVRRGQPHGAIALAACVAVIVLAALAPSGSATARSLRVTVVQGGGPQGTHAIHSDPRKVFDRHLEATRTIPSGSADLVVWPENVVDVPTFEGSDEMALIVDEADRIGAPIAVGITEDVAASTGVDGFLNAQVVVAPDGTITSRYDKVRRVPFGEYMPLRGLLDALGAPVDQVPRDAVAGTGPAVLDLPNGDRLGVVISWEVFFGARARDGVGHGGQLILNPTNGSSYTGTILQTQQIASSRLRAVETGRWVVQAAPTGFSAFVTDGGDVMQRTAISEQRVINQVVPLRSGRTWYGHLGDWPFALLAAAAAGGSWAMAVRSRRAA